MMYLLRRVRFGSIYAVFALLLAVVGLISIRTGAINLSYAQIWEFTLAALTGSPSSDSLHQAVFFQIRLPRVILSASVGAALSVSGVLMQALFRNPIVEPGLVGTSAGAAFGAALVFVLGKTIGAAYSDVLGAFALPVAAFAGALAATLAVYRFSALSGKVNVATMILAGVAVNAIANAGTGFMAYIARDPQARSITFWTLGTFTGADWKSATLVTTTMLLCTALALRYAKALNALLLGESDAMSLGVDVRRLNITLLVLNTVLVGTATAMVGVISFMGLVVPHLLRLIRSADNRFLIVASALLGAILMVIADTVARTLIAPAELPIGVITAFVGAPVFLWLLFRQHRDNEGKGGFYA